MPKNVSMLPKLFLFSSFLIIFSGPSATARTIHNPNPSHHPRNHYRERISFLMQDVFSMDRPSSLNPTEVESTTNHKVLPFSKPLGFFPPSKGIPLAGSDPLNQLTNPTSQTLDLTNKIHGYFPAKGTLQEELISGSLTLIEEDLFQNANNYSRSGPNSSVQIGKAKGVYVTSSGIGVTRHNMVAMTVFLGRNGGSREVKDGMRMFGVHRVGAKESHVSVIGGLGSYNGANGYASIKEFDDGGEKLLLFHVYLS